MSITGKTIGKVAMGVFGVALAYLFIGGIDCAPPDDGDFRLTETNNVSELAPDDGRKIFIDLTKRLENSDFPDGHCTLLDYANPEYGAGSMLIMNEDWTQDLVAAVLKEEAWATDAADRVAAAKQFSHGPIPDVCGLIELQRSALSARVKLAVERGEYDQAMRYWHSNLRLGTRLQTECATFVEYLVGVAIVGEQVDLMRRLVAEKDLPDSMLAKIIVELEQLDGLSQNAFTMSLRREYSIPDDSWWLENYGYQVGVDGDLINWVVEDICPMLKKSRKRAERKKTAEPVVCQVVRILLRPVARFTFHPNRFRRLLLNVMRDASEGRQPERESRASWLCFLLPNGYSEFDKHRCWATYSCVQNRRALKSVDKLRTLVAEHKLGRHSKDIAGEKGEADAASPQQVLGAEELKCQEAILRELPAKVRICRVKRIGDEVVVFGETDDVEAAWKLKKMGDGDCRSYPRVETFYFGGHLRFSSSRSLDDGKKSAKRSG